MSGQGAMGDRGCSLSSMVVIGMVLTALFVAMSILSSACAPQRTGAGTTSTTRENVCGETGVCEGSLGQDIERDESGSSASPRLIALGALVQSNASAEPARRTAAAAVAPPVNGSPGRPHPEQHDARANPAKSSSGVTTQGA